MIAPDRSSDRQVRHLEWRVRIFSVGALITVVGLYYDSGWIISAAIAVLLSAFVLRFIPTGSGKGSNENG